MSHHTPDFVVEHPRGEHEVNHAGISVSYPTDAAARAAAAEARNADRRKVNG